MLTQGSDLFSFPSEKVCFHVATCYDEALCAPIKELIPLVFQWKVRRNGDSNSGNLSHPHVREQNDIKKDTEQKE